MFKIKLYIFAALLIPALAFAHGPSRQKVVEEIEINATPEKIWEIISDFCGIKDWHPGITECQSDNGTQPDSTRVITLENGEQIKEKLIKHLPDKLMIQYMMVEPNPNAFPINTHGSTISIKPSDNGGSVVTWKGAFYRIFPGPTPPPDQTDKVGREAISGLYRSGLENIKKQAEQ